jgi:glycosyltransferase involved in cell wall biosynthesis
MLPMGGTEISYHKLREKIDSQYFEKINLILSTCDENSIDKSKINVLWQQLSYDQDNVKKLEDSEFVSQIDCFVFVSHWQYEKFRKIYSIPAYKSVIIPNATDRVEYQERHNEKLKLIYTSTPWRGLNVLLSAVELLDRDDIELDVYSSTKIYGDDFEKQMEGKFDDIFDHAKSLKNVNLLGYVTNDEIKKALSKADIFSYPSIFEETSCISAIEALAAGCKVVTTSYGALPETCGVWADYVTFGQNMELLVRRYAAKLNEVIDSYKSQKDVLIDQHKHYNRFYSWETRTNQWEDLFKKLIN